MTTTVKHSCAIRCINQLPLSDCVTADVQPKEVVTEQAVEG